jgi:hypothetical protein
MLLLPLCVCLCALGRHKTCASAVRACVRRHILRGQQRRRAPGLPMPVYAYGCGCARLRRGNKVNDDDDRSSSGRRRPTQRLRAARSRNSCAKRSGMQTGRVFATRSTGKGLASTSTYVFIICSKSLVFFRLLGSEKYESYS